MAQITECIFVVEGADLALSVKTDDPITSVTVATADQCFCKSDRRDIGPPARCYFGSFQFGDAIPLKIISITVTFVQGGEDSCMAKDFAERGIYDCLNKTWTPIYAES